MTMAKDVELGPVTAESTNDNPKAMEVKKEMEKLEGGKDMADVVHNNRGSLSCGDDAKKLRKLRFTLWKDGTVLSLAWLILYMGYNSISAVQSSLNSNQGLGVTTMCVEFASMTFGNLFTDSSIIKRLGCKWTIALGMGMYSVYMSMNFYPSWFTLVPLAAVSGISSAAMWVAQSTYLTRLGMAYGVRLGFDPDKYKGRFLGIFYMAYLSSNVLGNAVSSLILGSNIDSTASDERPYLEICGASYCNEDLNTIYGGAHVYRNYGLYNYTNFVQPSAASRLPGRIQIYAFCGFCVGCGILATIIVSLFLDTLPSIQIEEGIGDDQSTKQLLMASIRQWKDMKQVLLIPIGIYNGMDNPFWTAEFTKAFITCPIGMHFIGYVMMIYGLTSAVIAVIFGWFSNRRLRLLPFVLAFAIHFSTAITLLFWKTDPKNVTMLFVLSAIWGSGSGVWSSQIPIFYSMIFPDNLEAAFSNSRIWDAVGRTISYGWSYPLCTSSKIYLVISVVSVGILGLIAIEIREWYANKRQSKVNQIENGTIRKISNSNS